MTWRLDSGQIEVVDSTVAMVLRKKTPDQRVAMIFDANHTMRLLIEGSLRTYHPNWDDEQIAREVVRRMTHGSG